MKTDKSSVKAIDFEVLSIPENASKNTSKMTPQNLHVSVIFLSFFGLLLWGGLGVHFGPILGTLGAILGRSWAPLGRSCGPLGRAWGPLGRPWGALGRSWGALGCS